MSWLVLLPWLLLTGHTVVNALLLRRPSRGTTAVTLTEKIAVLLPLRDEAGRVTPCLKSLLAQRDVPNLEIYILDDGSTDGTADVVRAVAGDRVHLLTGAPLPAGWLGKPHACQQLADAAPDAAVLSFVDADVTLTPDALASATTLLRRTGVDLLSPYPKIAGAGRLVQPLLQWSWLTFLPLRAMERSPRPSLTAAGGQWLLIDRKAYDRAGGHAAVRTEILEDIALARAIKRSGGHVALAAGSPLATAEMYASWRDLVDGYAKSLWSSFGSAPAAAAVATVLLVLYTVPPLAALILLAVGAVQPALIAFTAYLLGVLGRVVTAVATDGRAFPDALAHPASVVAFVWLLRRSFRLRRRGGLSWRGRTV